jgi:hypothetical protein
VKGKKTGKRVPKVRKKSAVRDLAPRKDKTANVRGGMVRQRLSDPDDDILIP